MEKHKDENEREIREAKIGLKRDKQEKTTQK